MALSGAYCASKFAIKALVQTAGEAFVALVRSDKVNVYLYLLAKEYADDGITVNAYAPGIIDTPLSKSPQILTPIVLGSSDDHSISSRNNRRLGVERPRAIPRNSASSPRNLRTLPESDCVCTGR